MEIEMGTNVKLKTFHGKTFSKEYQNTIDDYWKLIGLTGTVIEENNIDFPERVLVKFEKDLDAYKVANHNPIKNTLWINKTDLEII
jgi:hypothetical protein